MAEQGSTCEAVRDGFVGELTEAALQVASRHGVYGFSVDQEIGLWKRLGEVVGRRRNSAADDRDLPEVLSAELALAAYEASLERGFRGSFLELQLDLWTALRRVAREGTWAPLFWSRFRRGSEGVRNRGRRPAEAAVA